MRERAAGFVTGLAGAVVLVVAVSCLVERELRRA